MKMEIADVHWERVYLMGGGPETPLNNDKTCMSHYRARPLPDGTVYEILVLSNGELLEEFRTNFLVAPEYTRAYDLPGRYTSRETMSINVMQERASRYWPKVNVKEWLGRFDRY